MSSINVSNVVSTSLTQTINFLTRPLVLTHASTTIISLQLILQTTLAAAFIPARQNRHPRMILTLSPTCLPPRPIYAACIASGVQWSEWIRALGGREFDLLVDSDYVALRFGGKMGQIIPVWSTETIPTSSYPAQPELPTARRGQAAMQASLQATLSSALARAKSRTLAQEILESHHEEEEAEEMFAMISNTSIISPTPTREQFKITPCRVPSPVSSSEDSRPSSRSSTNSGFSFSSAAESFTSVSSTYSMPQMKSPTPPVAVSQLSSLPQPWTRRERPVASRPRVFVDNNKKDVTKYSYEGGVSTVLTGGVMLGGAARPSAPVKAPAYFPPKPISSRRVEPSNGNWRRTTRI